MNTKSAIASLLLTAIVGFTAGTAPAQEPITPKPTQQAAFDVIGISVRTNNAAEGSGNGAIPQQWQRLFAEGIMDRIPGKADQAITVVYTNYAADWNGDYDYFIGAKVKAGTKPPVGMVNVSVPAGKYLEFESARGNGQTVIPEVWRQIWTYFQDPANPKRAFQADFERYEYPTDQNNVHATIFIGVKP